MAMKAAPIEVLVVVEGTIGREIEKGAGAGIEVTSKDVDEDEANTLACYTRGDSSVFVLAVVVEQIVVCNFHASTVSIYGLFTSSIFFFLRSIIARCCGVYLGHTRSWSFCAPSDPTTSRLQSACDLACSERKNMVNVAHFIYQSTTPPLLRSSLSLETAVSCRIAVVRRSSHRIPSNGCRPRRNRPSRTRIG